MKKLKVYYGLRKLTKKAVRKPSIIVAFENGYSYKNEKQMNRLMKILHTRDQTKEELQDAKKSNRMFTVYELFFLNDKRYKNDPEIAIESNFNADKNHVIKKERLEIKKKFQQELYRFYDLKKPKPSQLQLF